MKICRRKREAAAKQEAQSERTTERQRQRQAAFVPPKVAWLEGYNVTELLLLAVVDGFMYTCTPGMLRASAVLLLLPY